MASSFRREPWILGINASHNGAACLLRGDQIVVAVQEERLTRVKGKRITAATPALAIAYCLTAAGIGAGELDMVVLCTQGRGNSADHDVSRNWLLQTRSNGTPVERIPHHLGHAISAFALSGFSESAVLVVDGMGSSWRDLPPAERAVVRRAVDDGYETASLYRAAGTDIAPLGKHLVANGGWISPDRLVMPRFGSLGGVYAAAAVQIFGRARDPGKVMGLSSFGDQNFATDDFFSVADEGFIFHDTVPRAFQMSERWPQHAERYRNLARSAQVAVEEGVLHLARRLRSLSGSPRLCYAGGVALNGIANERLFAEAGFEDIFIIPPADDSGSAIGAAYWGLWQLTGTNGRVALAADALGRTYDTAEIETAAKEVGAVRLVADSNYIEAAADLICDGRILGWFSGRSELGPRALGQRSIICDPRNEGMKNEINARVKRREAFRPFAPAILEDAVPDWFETNGMTVASPFMLRVRPFKADRAGRVPAVVHVDGTGRLQTLNAKSNGPFYQLVESFNRRTGVPMVLNTSFNGPDEPIVETPLDALRCMLANGLDGVVFPGMMALRV
jgi:carbamoyltransferase